MAAASAYNRHDGRMARQGGSRGSRHSQERPHAPSRDILRGDRIRQQKQSGLNGHAMIDDDDLDENGGGGGPDESVQMNLESYLYSSEDLYSEYTQVDMLLSEAELRLSEHRITKFDGLQKTVRGHVHKWRDLLVDLQKQALAYRNEFNTLFVTNEKMVQELKERDEIIETLRVNHDKDSHAYEQQLSSLESLLAQVGPSKKGDSSSSKQRDPLSNDDVSAVRRELETSLRRWQQQEIEHKKLQKSLSVMKFNASEKEQECLELTDQMARKEEEILQLQWTVEDLSTERLRLEDELASFKANFDRQIAEAKASSSSAFSALREDDKSSSKKDDPYTLDLSAFDRGGDMYGDDSDSRQQKSDPSATNFLDDDTQDADISSHVLEKMKNALAAVKQMAQDGGGGAGKSRRGKGISFEDDSGGPSKSGASAAWNEELDFNDHEIDDFVDAPIPKDADRDELISQLQMSKEIIGQLRTDVEDLQLRIGSMDDDWNPEEDFRENKNDSREAERERALGRKKSKHERFFSTFNILNQEFETGGHASGDYLIQQMGQYNALTTSDAYDNERTYKLVMDSLRLKLKNGQTQCNMIEEHVREMIDEMQMEAGMGNLGDGSQTMNALRMESMTQMASSARKLAELVEDVIDELKGAESYVHPDQKRVEMLQIKFKELQNSMPYITTQKLAVLHQIPPFISKELGKYDDMKKKQKALLADKTGIVEKAIREQQAHENRANQERIRSFNATLEGLESNNERILEKMEYIRRHLLDVLENGIVLEDGAQQELQISTINEIKDSLRVIDESLDIIGEEFTAARDFVHPTHEALIQACMRIVDISVDNERLKRDVKKLSGELEATVEALNAKPGVDRPAKFGAGSSKDSQDRSRDEFVMKNGPSTGGTKRRRSSHREKSWGFGSVDFDFLAYSEYELKGNDDFGIADDDEAPDTNNDEALKQAMEFVPKMDDKLKKLRERTIWIQNMLRESGLVDGHSTMLYNDMKDLAEQIDGETSYIVDLIGQMKSVMTDAQSVISGVDARYIFKLENRYRQMKGLYKMKFAEVENMRDNLYHADQKLEGSARVKEELQFKIQQLMTRSMAPSELRIEALTRNGQKSQTYGRVMKFMDEAIKQGQQLCENIQAYVGKDLSEVVRDSLGSQQRKNLQTLTGHVNDNCAWILKILKNIKEEMNGAKQFVHPDRGHVEALESKIVELQEELQMVESGQREGTAPGIAAPSEPDNDENKDEDENDDDEDEDRKSFLDFDDESDDYYRRNNKRESNLRVPKMDPKKAEERRQSINQITAILTKRSSRVSRKHRNPLQREDDIRRRRSQRLASQRRGSSGSANQFFDRIAAIKQEMQESRSDIGIRTGEKMSEADLAHIRALQIPKWEPKHRGKETPANSPTAEPEVPGSRTGLGTDEIPFMMAMDDEPLITSSGQNNMGSDTLVIEDDAEISGFGNDNASGRSGNRRGRSGSQMEWKKMYEEQSQLVNDLNANINALKQSRVQEIKAMQVALDQMRNRFRDWYQRLMSKVDEMEGDHEDEIKRIRENSNVGGDTSQLDDYKNELAQLHEDLDTWKDKFFIHERKKLQQLADKDAIIDKMQGIIDDFQRKNGNGAGDAGERNEDVSTEQYRVMEKENESLKQMLQQQEVEYEAEVEEFERIANRKLHELEEHYRKQIEQYQSQLTQAQQSATIAAKSSQAPTKMVENPDTVAKLAKAEAISRELRQNEDRLKARLSQYESMLRENKRKFDDKLTKYGDSFKELAKQLKEVSETAETEAKKSEKYKKKLQSVREKKKKLKSDLKKLQKQHDNLAGVGKDMMQIRKQFKESTKEWEERENEMQVRIDQLESDMTNLAKVKRGQTIRYASEMDKMRQYIRAIEKQRRTIQNDYDELETQSMAQGSIFRGPGNSVPPRNGQTAPAAVAGQATTAPSRGGFFSYFTG